MCKVYASVPAFAVIQNALVTAWAANTTALYTAMQTEADTQAALEQAWLEAWYLQQYWAALKVELTATTASSKSKAV